MPNIGNDNRRSVQLMRRLSLIAASAYILALVLNIFAADTVSAQITFGGGGSPAQPITAICSVGGTVTVSNDYDCNNTQNFPTNFQVGPSGSATILNAGNGDATFQGVANFQNTTIFSGGAVNFTANAPVTFSTVAPVNFQTGANFNQGFAVAAGQTVDMGGNRVQNVGTPTAGTDATNKIYVDGLHNLQQTQIDNIVVVNNQQNTRLTNVETVNAQQDTRLNALESASFGQASQIAAINKSLEKLGRRDGELADGIAIAMSVAQPVFQTGQRFAIRAGWGNFDGANAIGLTAAGLLANFRGGGSLVLDVGGGVSTKYNMVAGRAGLTLGW